MAPTTALMNHASTSVSSLPPAPRARGQKASALHGDTRVPALWLTTLSKELTAGPWTVLPPFFSARLDRLLPCAPAAFGRSSDLFPPTSLFRLL